MKRAGVYMVKESGTIWLVSRVEYYPASVFPGGSKEMTIIVSGSVGGKQKINRCLIKGYQYKYFVRIGDL